MPERGRIEVQSDMSAETAGGARGDRGHIDGHVLAREIAKIRPVTVTEAPPVAGFLYGITPSRKAGGNPAGEANYVNPVPDQRVIIDFGPRTAGWLAQPARGIGEPAIHARSVTGWAAEDFLRAHFPDTPGANPTQATTHCANCAVTGVLRRAGTDAYAAPSPGRALEDVARDFGLSPADWQRWRSYEEVIRHIRSRPLGAETVVFQAVQDKWGEGLGHYVNGVNTEHGVVFLDDQAGGLAKLEPNATVLTTLDVDAARYGTWIDEHGRVVNPRQWPGVDAPTS